MKKRKTTNKKSSKRKITLKKNNKKKIDPKKNIKRKTNSLTRCKKCKMSLRNKEFLAVTILVFFVFAFLLAFVNTPEQSVTVTGQVVEGVEGISTGQIGTFLTNIMNPEKVDAMVLKWVVFFVFTLGIWGGISLFFKKGKGGIFKLLALPISFAMVYLLKPSEIFAGLIGYSALGMTIIVILPFLAIIFFSVKLLEKESTINTVVEVMVWYFYLAFLIYFLIRAFLVGETYSLGILGIIAGGIIVSILAIWKNEWVREKIHKYNMEATRKRLEHSQQARLTEARGELAKGQQAKEFAYEVK